VDQPRAGVHYPTSTGEFQTWFRTDADCLDYLEWLRWPGGFTCPSCGHVEGWRLGDGRAGVRRLSRGHVGGGGHDLRPDPDAADGVVHRVLAARHSEGRHFCAEPVAVGGDRLLPDRVGDAAPAAVGSGAAGVGQPGRDRGGGRDVHRRGRAGAARRPGPRKETCSPASRWRSSSRRGSAGAGWRCWPTARSDRCTRS
jgi:Transposase zinc-ribbon domain